MCSPDIEQTNPTKPGSVSFVGPLPADSLKIEAATDPAKQVHACAVLNRAGVRIMALEDRITIGVWSDLDGPDIRAALRVLRMALAFPCPSNLTGNRAHTSPASNAASLAGCNLYLDENITTYC